MANEPGSGRKTHGIEQLGGVGVDLAHPVAAFYHALVKADVPDASAAHLAGVFLTKLLGDATPS